MDVTIVYYSRGGTVEGLAGLIAEEIRRRGHSVNSVPIRPSKRTGFLRTGWLSRKEAKVEIANGPQELDLAPHDVILVGGPIFAGKVNPWTRAFIARAKGLEGKAGGVFIACATKVAEAGGYIEEMAALVGERGLVVRGRLIGSKEVQGRYPELARSFVEDVLPSSDEEGH